MDDLKQVLFTAHFTNGRDLSNDRILAEISKEIGIDRAEAIKGLLLKYAKNRCSGHDKVSAACPLCSWIASIW